MIYERIGVPALLEQLAEECAELAQSALKLSRVMRAENPTPTSVKDAREHLMEEIADVEVCLHEVKVPPTVNVPALMRMKDAKRERWDKRLTEAGM